MPLAQKTPLFHVLTCQVVLLDSFGIRQFVIGQFNDPIILKAVVTFVRARVLTSCFWCLIASRRHSGIRMFTCPL